jgi:hypothetical protein
MAKVKFWALCSDLIKEEFSKDMLHPGWIEKAWADRRRKEIELEDGSREVSIFLLSFDDVLASGSHSWTET